MSGLIETWRGEALAWEADELGHMNMRYYFDRALEARARFAHHLGLHHIYKATSLSTLVPTRQHIKYIKELRPGHAMAVSSGVVEIGETDITLVHEITGLKGTLSATILETLSHIAVRSGVEFSWSRDTKKRARQYKIELPQTAKPRNIDLGEALGITSTAQADSLGLQAIGRGVFRPSECDVFGYVLPTSIVGRISNSVQHLTTAWPDLDFASDAGMSGALLEACVRHKIQAGRRPKAGDLYEIRSGLRKASTHVRELCHWVLDPVTGECWSSFVGVGCRFNLKTRRLVKTDDATLALLNKGIVTGLKP